MMRCECNLCETVGRQISCRCRRRCQRLK